MAGARERRRGGEPDRPAADHARIDGALARREAARSPPSSGSLPKPDSWRTTLFASLLSIELRVISVW